MKKLILMLLSIVCALGQSSATTRRIYVKQEISGWNSNISTYGLNLFLEKNSTAITDAWPGTAMTSIGNNWYYLDVDSEETDVTACLICPVSEGYWYVGDSFRPKDVNLSNNNVLYLYEQDSKAKISAETFTGYAIANGYTAASNTLSILTQDGLELTGTLDLSSAGGNTNFWVFPTILSSGTYYVGAVAICPSGTSNYSLSAFTNYSSSIAFGDTYKWVESANQKYDISVDLSTGTFTFTPYVSASLNASGYGTFGCSFADFKIPAKDTDNGDVSAYYAASADNHLVTMSKLNSGTDVNKADGLFLIGTASKTLKFTPATTSPSTVSSKLKPGSGANVASSASGPYRYVFSGDAFKKLSTTGTTVPEGKAYLESATLLANELTFSFDDDNTTAIRIIDADATAKSNDIYNIAGQRVANPTKGLYIVNGKKVMVK